MGLGIDIEKSILHYISRTRDMLAKEWSVHLQNTCRDVNGAADRPGLLGAFHG